MVELKVCVNGGGEMDDVDGSGVAVDSWLELG